MYTVKNFKSKKELKNAVEANRILTNAVLHLSRTDVPATIGACEAQQILRSLTPLAVRYFQPGPFGGSEPVNGTFSVEGPHYPQPHKWYARCTAKDGIIIKVS